MRTLHAISYRQRASFKVLGGFLFGSWNGKKKDILLGSVPKYVAMRSWRVFWDYPNVITLQILAVKVVDLTERVYGSNPLIFSHSRIRFKWKCPPLIPQCLEGFLKHNGTGARTLKKGF